MARQPSDARAPLGCSAVRNRVRLRTTRADMKQTAHPSNRCARRSAHRPGLPHVAVEIARVAPDHDFHDVTGTSLAPVASSTFLPPTTPTRRSERTSCPMRTLARRLAQICGVSLPTGASGSIWRSRQHWPQMSCSSCKLMVIVGARERGTHVLLDPSSRLERAKIHLGSICLFSGGHGFLVKSSSARPHQATEWRQKGRVSARYLLFPLRRAA